MGRPSKLTPELQAKLCANLALGAFDHVAAEAAGIGYATFKEWLARGEARDPHRPVTPQFAAFAADIRKAQAEARQAAEWEVRKINPLAWLRYGPGRDRPDRPGWTDGSRTEVGGVDRTPIVVKVELGWTLPDAKAP